MTNYDISLEAIKLLDISTFLEKRSLCIAIFDQNQNKHHGNWHIKKRLGLVDGFRWLAVLYRVSFL